MMVLVRQCLHGVDKVRKNHETHTSVSVRLKVKKKYNGTHVISLYPLFLTFLISLPLVVEGEWHDHTIAGEDGGC